jgi:hypothetical protein
VLVILSFGAIEGERFRRSSRQAPNSCRNGPWSWFSHMTTKAEAKVVVVLRTQLIPHLFRTTSKIEG